MGDAANVRAIHALDELRAALGSFSTAGAAALSAMNREIQRAREWLQECLREWRRELATREQALADAQRALNACQRSGYTDKEGRYHAPDCSRQEAAARAAAAAVYEAQAALKEIATQGAHIEAAANEFTRSAQTLSGMFSSELAQGAALLASSFGILSAYAAGGGGGGGGGGAGGGGGGAGGGGGGASGGASAQTFTNNYPHALPRELEDARNVGFQRITPQNTTDATFQRTVNDGTIKWVVDQDGVLHISPKTVHGQEISHAALAGGRPVLAAGEANISARGGAVIGLELSNYSGHYRPTAASIDIGTQAFGRLGIVFATIERFEFPF